MLSFAFISTLFTSGPEVPSTFILKGEEYPPESFTCERRSFSLLLLKILKDCVTEPTVVKTVSNDKVSILVYNVASGLVVKESFLQEKNNMALRKMRYFKMVELLYCCIVESFKPTKLFKPNSALFPQILYRREVRSTKFYKSFLLSAFLLSLFH